MNQYLLMQNTSQTPFLCVDIKKIILLQLVSLASEWQNYENYFLTGSLLVHLELQDKVAVDTLIPVYKRYLKLHFFIALHICFSEKTSRTNRRSLWHQYILLPLD